MDAQREGIPFHEIFDAQEMTSREIGGLTISGYSTPGQRGLPRRMPQVFGSQATGNLQTTRANSLGGSTGSPGQAQADNSWRRRHQPIRRLTCILAGGLNGREAYPPEGTSDEMNCSVYVTNLPPQCTVHMLLSSIRHVGKVFASHIQPPSGSHSTAAAKIVFWDQASTARFMEQSRNGRWAVEGYTPFVRYNRTPAQPQRPSPRSRVLQVRGPADLLSEAYLNRVFRVYCTYELEGVSSETLPSGVAQFEFRFSSFRGQAYAAYSLCNALRHRDPKGLTAVENEDADFRKWMDDDELDKWSRVYVHWAPDPCDYRVSKEIR